MEKILTLTPEDSESNKPTKTLDQELNKLKSFDAGFNFYFETLEYESLHDVIKLISAGINSFMVLGDLTEYGEALEDSGAVGKRRKKKGDPTIKDRDGNQIVLDLDDHILPGFDPKKPEAGIKHWLTEKKINCDVTWQITSGQKLNTEEARIRLYFEATKALPLLERKAWSQSPDIGADGSVYTCSQPIYTASPIIEGGSDPIKKRWGFIKGKSRKIKLPTITPEEIKKNSGYVRAGVEWDFDDFELPSQRIAKALRRAEGPSTGT